jgi:hypothetical protein
VQVVKRTKQSITNREWVTDGTLLLILPFTTHNRHHNYAADTWDGATNHNGVTVVGFITDALVLLQMCMVYIDGTGVKR